MKIVAGFFVLCVAILSVSACATPGPAPGPGGTSPPAASASIDKALSYAGTAIATAEFALTVGEQTGVIPADKAQRYRSAIELVRQVVAAIQAARAQGHDDPAATAEQARQLSGAIDQLRAASSG